MESIRVRAYIGLNIVQLKLRFNLRASRCSGGVLWHPYPNSIPSSAYK